MAKEEWGVDGYGSMSGLIRLRSPKEAEDEGDGSSDSSESDVEEHVEVERRLDHDLSRFEMVYPVELDEPVEGDGVQALAEARVARLEEENLTLQERLFLVQTEMDEIRKRLEELEKRFARANRDNKNPSNGVEEDMNVDYAHGADREDVDGSNVVEENINRSNVVELEENLNVEDAHGSTGVEENVGGEDVDGGNKWEELMNGEDVYGGNREDSSPVISVGTPVRY